jgi:hypothetical protein
MAKPNYAFAKRQRDLAKKQAKEEKLQKKREAAAAAANGEAVEQTDGDAATDETGETGEAPAAEPQS